MAALAVPQHAQERTGGPRGARERGSEVRAGGHSVLTVVRLRLLVDCELRLRGGKPLREQRALVGGARALAERLDLALELRDELLAAHDARAAA